MFRDRLMFPERDHLGPVGFTARARPGADLSRVPKYRNTSRTALYDKGWLLFGLTEQRDRIGAGWRPALVEGPTDVLATWVSYLLTGATGTVAVTACGTALTTEQAQIVCRLPGAAHGIVVAFDADAAGHAAIDKT